ncbi:MULTISPECIES: pYEATS domain-containing protein [unclassified Streptomyces]|uniref:pYEATS domain-containing protein n=1 Tax=unclassified Streptomyces TaxID=2593676 RepID=UPI0037140659
MKDWIPFLQALIWPGVVLTLALTFRARLGRLIEAINSRVERGDSFEAGASGIRLGPSAPQTPTGVEPQPGAQPVLEVPPPLAELTEGSNDAAPRVHLVHTAHRDSGLDKDGYRYFRLRIGLEGDRDSDLDRVAKVVYHLHPTFRDPDRTVTNRSTGFELTTAAWGNFSLTADVYVKGDAEPIRLERYLDF